MPKSRVQSSNFSVHPGAPASSPAWNWRLVSPFEASVPRFNRFRDSLNSQLSTLNLSSILLILSISGTKTAPVPGGCGSRALKTLFSPVLAGLERGSQGRFPTVPAVPNRSRWYSFSRLGRVRPSSHSPTHPLTPLLQALNSQPTND